MSNLDYKDSNIWLMQGDCLEKMKAIPDKSVDLILTDLPYGVTRNRWDSIIPLEPMWDQFHRIAKDNAAIVLTATQPFAAKLIVSNMEYFRYDIIWEKTISSGQLNVMHQPLRSHESILVFYKKRPTYNEQLTEGKPYSIKRNGDYKNTNYNKQAESSKQNTGFRHARSVIKISNPRIKGGHPTQKPIELMTHLIKTYSNPENTVLDCCMGHGTTGVASILQDRKFIGIELDTAYYERAKQEIQDAVHELTKL